MEKFEGYRLETGRYGPFLTRFGRDSESRLGRPDPRQTDIASRAIAAKAPIMPAIHVTTRTGDCRTLEVPPGRSLMESLKGAGINDILALCGGCASCGTCHVHVAEDWLPRLSTMRADEDELLGYSDWRQPNSRLACQIPFTEALDGIVLTVAPED